MDNLADGRENLIKRQLYMVEKKLQTISTTTTATKLRKVITITIIQFLFCKCFTNDMKEIFFFFQVFSFGNLYSNQTVKPLNVICHWARLSFHSFHLKENENFPPSHRSANVLNKWRKNKKRKWDRHEF